MQVSHVQVHSSNQVAAFHENNANADQISNFPIPDLSFKTKGQLRRIYEELCREYFLLKEEKKKQDVEIIKLRHQLIEFQDDFQNTLRSIIQHHQQTLAAKDKLRKKLDQDE